MKKKSSEPRIAVLPLMFEMYKSFDPDFTTKQQPFLEEIHSILKRFSDVLLTPICSSHEAVARAIDEFEQLGVDGIILIFTSYAPSMVALRPLLSTTLPLLLFCTSPRQSMADGFSMQDILLNHGVHGYMDLANVLKRHGRKYSFASGHFREEKAIAAVGRWVALCRLARDMNNAKIGVTGHAFDGMGDLGVDSTFITSRLGPEVVSVPLSQLSAIMSSVSEAEIRAENRRDRERFTIQDDVEDPIHGESNRLYLTLSRAAEEIGLSGYTMNFQDFLSFPGMKTQPFLGISKLQEEGMGYAGEADVLGATACTMLQSLFGRALFSEPFCPDFENGRILMGHMGESNPALGEETVLKRKRLSFGAPIDPVVADVHMKEQLLTIANLAVLEEARFQLTVFRASVSPRVAADESVDMPYFHIKPELELSDLLNRYGLVGASHHVILTEGDRTNELRDLADWYGLSFVILE